MVKSTLIKGELPAQHTRRAFSFMTITISISKYAYYLPAELGVLSEKNEIEQEIANLHVNFIC
jgi:hypothetical protein